MGRGGRSEATIFLIAPRPRAARQQSSACQARCSLRRLGQYAGLSRGRKVQTLEALAPRPPVLLDPVSTRLRVSLDRREEACAEHAGGFRNLVIRKVFRFLGLLSR